MCATFIQLSFEFLLCIIKIIYDVIFSHNDESRGSCKICVIANKVAQHSGKIFEAFGWFFKNNHKKIIPKFANGCLHSQKQESMVEN